ncbi:MULTISPECIES: LysR family transcriptional regulator [unclassified Clostridium]|uniref:LysR substrate-binding domain-containing protein n=1 Tax=unclassified Clostridium TaxID=2614128 RepID=UPI000297B9CD|nr:MULTISPECIES: LysR family transcriptional regulator [unclassified Clostridium]EKQ57114.1 MAG: transcriptional regulator [Clostridium sp. Maddingley MBC34-26]
MNFKQIDYAIEVSHTLNFRRAAENLFISQPALTYQIQSLEEEIGFPLFYRTGKGATLTPAGEQFCMTLVNIKDDISKAIQNGKNYNVKYKESLNIAIPLRSAIYFLPQIMKQFAKEYPSVSINIHYVYGNSRIDELLHGEQDIIFGLGRSLSSISNLKAHHLFDSHIYLITQKDDPLSKLEKITPDDLKGQTLMVGGGSPYELQKIQQLVINTVDVQTINSPDHITTLTNVAAGIGVCLSPGFCNDHLGEFIWTPFDTKETMDCVFCTRKEENRPFVERFIEISKDYYKMCAIQL